MAAAHARAAAAVYQCGDYHRQPRVRLREGRRQPDVSLWCVTCASGKKISSVVFAAIRLPAGTCGNFTAASSSACGSDPIKAKQYVTSQCAGKASCSLSADIGTFNGGTDPCAGKAKHIEVEVVCS